MVFLHPVHNYALIAYDPSALGAVGASVVRAAELLPGNFDYINFNSSLFNFIWSLSDSLFWYNSMFMLCHMFESFIQLVFFHVCKYYHICINFQVHRQLFYLKYAYWRRIFILSETEPTLRRGDSVYLVGLSRSLQATSRKSIVTNPCAALNIGSADCPRYRATNMEVIELDTGNCTFITKVDLIHPDFDIMHVWYQILVVLFRGC